MEADYQRCGVKEYITSLVEALDQVFREVRKINYKLEIQHFSLSTKDLFALGIMVNEVMTNVLKHAFPGRQEGSIQLTLEKRASRVRVIIQDDGIGVEASRDENKSPGFGGDIVRMLAESMNGFYQIENRTPGTRSVLEFEVQGE